MGPTTQQRKGLESIGYNVRDTCGRTTLHLFMRATSSRPHQGVKFILEKIVTLVELGVDASLQDDDGNTALHTLISSIVWYEVHEFFPVVTMLVEVGTNLNAQDKQGKTALDRIIRLWKFYKLDDMLTLFAAFVTRNTTMPSARARGRSHTLSEFLQIVCGEEPGYDSMVTAVTKLLDLGADPNLQDDRRETILHLLTKYTFPIWNVVDVLLNHGADPTIGSYLPLNNFFHPRYAFDPTSVFLIIRKNDGRSLLTSQLGETVSAIKSGQCH